MACLTEQASFSSGHLIRDIYTVGDVGSVVVGCEAAPACCQSAACKRCSASVDSDVCNTVPPYLLISGTTLSIVTLRTSTNMAELFGVISVLSCLTKLSSMP